MHAPQKVFTKLPSNTRSIFHWCNKQQLLELLSRAKRWSDRPLRQHTNKLTELGTERAGSHFAVHLHGLGDVRARSCRTVIRKYCSVVVWSPNKSINRSRSGAGQWPTRWTVHLVETGRCRLGHAGENDGWRGCGLCGTGESADQAAVLVLQLTAQTVGDEGAVECGHTSAAGLGLTVDGEFEGLARFSAQTKNSQGEKQCIGDF